MNYRALVRNALEPLFDAPAMLAAFAALKWARGGSLMPGTVEELEEW